MGESACLVRSFTHPSDTFREVREGDPIRALKESVSFGRFVSESLNWERWSTFSQNRYLEEIEKLSKPGTVAQRKAYFEACYQKRAAMKMATTAQVATTATNDVPEIESTRKIRKDFQVDTKSGNINMATNEQVLDVISDSEVAYSADANASEPSTKTEKITMVEGGDAIVEKNVHMESSSLLENSELLGKAENYEYMAGPEEKMLDNEDFTSSRKGEQANSSWKSLINGGGSENAVSHCRQPRQSTFVPVRKRNDVALNGKTLPRNLNDTRTSMSKSPHRSINLASHAAETSEALLRIPKDNLAPLRPTSIHFRNRNNNLPDTKLSSGGSNTKKRLIPTSLHMSINFGPHTGEASRTSCKIPKTSSTTVGVTSVVARNENVHPNNKVSTGYSNKKNGSKANFLNMSVIASQTCETSKISPRMPKDDSNFARASAKTSVMTAPHPSKSLHAEAKRTCKTNISLNKSVSGGITTNRKGQSSVDHAKFQNSSRATAQSTISTPFSFRSEERAAKRKEFFKRLEEKNNGKAVEREQQPTRWKRL